MPDTPAQSPMPAGARSSSSTRDREPKFVVLMGPPGSGKTYLGHALAAAFRVEFIEGERLLLEKYGSTENFVRHKAEALRAYYDHLAALQAERGGVFAFESTGLSDRPQLLALIEANDCALVRIAAPRELCLERVARRAAGGNFKATDPGQFDEYWHAEVEPKYSFELTIDNHGQDLRQTLQRLAQALCLSARGGV
jgi:shikimate kinase